MPPAATDEPGVNLEGSLDVFGLTDIFGLLRTTRKSGALHLRRDPGQQGVVYVVDGAVSGASSDVSRQWLARRLVGGGHLPDAALRDAIEQVRADPSTGLGRAIAATGAVDAPALQQVAREQSVDAIFDLLRWREGGFAFAVGATDPDDVGIRLDVETLVGEARGRLARWDELAARIPSPDLVLAATPAPAEDVTLTPEEWGLVSLVDGQRSVAELVQLRGRGEYETVAGLVALVQRGLLVVPTGEQPEAGAAALLRRQRLLEPLEAAADPRGVPAPGPHAGPEPSPADVPEPEPVPLARRSPAAAGPGVVEHAPVVTRTLLLRLIAGVRGL